MISSTGTASTQQAMLTDDSDFFNFYGFGFVTKTLSPPFGLIDIISNTIKFL